MLFPSLPGRREACPRAPTWGHPSPVPRFLSRLVPREASRVARGTGVPETAGTPTRRCHEQPARRFHPCGLPEGMRAGWLRSELEYSKMRVRRRRVVLLPAGGDHLIASRDLAL